MWRGDLYMLKLADYEQYYGQKVTLVGKAMNDATYNDRAQLSFDAHNVMVERQASN